MAAVSWMFMFSLRAWVEVSSDFEKFPWRYCIHPSFSRAEASPFLYFSNSARLRASSAYTSAFSLSFSRSAVTNSFKYHTLLVSAGTEHARLSRLSVLICWAKPAEKKQNEKANIVTRKPTNRCDTMRYNYATKGSSELNAVKKSVKTYITPGEKVFNKNAR